MTDITELAQQEMAQLRDELLNQEIGSKDHLRKIALSLLDKLEKCRDREIRWLALSDEKSKIITDQEEALAAEKRICATWRKTAEANSEKLEKAQQRIAELEEAEQKLCAANVTLDARAELAERQRIAELESRTVSVKLLTPEVRNALKAEGLADVLKDAAEYAPLTAGQWETLTKNWYQTFIGLSGTAAGIKVEAE
ncbi:ead/Ea22-like family protein [Klebsiella pneumoniae]|uniref:ead/Ea22-like family protein n=1 Tax=Klebsiella pneumoniae TaxID=573 RepID=UPI00215ADF48|nr:ead/Ea22-like family protein [Klebsiella pneumoniae]MDW5577215.1 ead/Ea22-like family protein [Klebsiella pneumoniae]